MPIFHRFLELGAARGHKVKAQNKEMFLAGDLQDVDVVCLKGYTDDKHVWEMIDMHGVRAVNSRAAGECCTERGRLDTMLCIGGVRTPRRASSTAEVMCLNYPIIRKPNAMSAPRDLQVFHQPPAEIDCERYFYQELIASDGATYKVYCIGEETFLVKELDVADEETLRRQAVPIPDHLVQAARAVGKLTGLEIYGVDFVETPDKLFLIDVNPFPSFRALPQAAEALWDYLEKSV